MMFLESPALGASKSEWEAWAKQLSTLKQKAPSVAFARKRAEAVLSRMAEHEQVQAQKATPAFT